jgi:dUTPase
LSIESQGTHFIDVYILPVTSHSLIFGTDYLMKNNIVLDCSKISCNLKSANLQTQRLLHLDPNTETTVWARVLSYVIIDLQGVCSKSKFSCGKGLLLAKSVATVPNNRKVHVKLLNPTNETIVIPKGRTIVQCNVLNSEYDCTSFSDSVPTVQHAQLCETDTAFY